MPLFPPDQNQFSYQGYTLSGLLAQVVGLPSLDAMDQWLIDNPGKALGGLYFLTDHPETDTSIRFVIQSNSTVSGSIYSISFTAWFDYMDLLERYRMFRSAAAYSCSASPS